MTDNKIDGKKLKPFVREIERCDDEKETEHGAYMNKCAAINERRNGWIQQAKEGGTPVRELKAILKTRKLRGKLDAIYDGLDEDQQEIFTQMELALGDDVEPKREKKATKPKGMPGADSPGSAH